MKVNIVSVLYNKEKTITHFLDCLYKQSCLDFELILVNDCSPDRTIATLYKYIDSRPRKFPIKVLNNKKNLGNCHSRNTGINEATGEIIIIIDADCLVNVDFIKEHIEAHKDPYYQIIIGPMGIETNYRSIPSVIKLYEDTPNKAIVDSVLQDNSNRNSYLNCVTRNFSIKRSSIPKDEPLFDIDFSYSINPESGFGWEDIEMGYRMFKHGLKVKFIETAYSIHISHPSSINEKSKPFRSAKNFKKLFLKHPELFVLSKTWALQTYRKLLAWKQLLKLPDNEDFIFLKKTLGTSNSTTLSTPICINTSNYRIATYRWHVPHQYELYKLPYKFSLVVGTGCPMTESWGYEQRPLPANASFANSAGVKPGKYDLAILHFDENSLNSGNSNGVLPKEWGNALKWLNEHTNIPKVAICHGTPQFYGQYSQEFIDNKDIKIIESERQRIVDYFKDILVIVNSYQAQKEWQFKKSKVIWHGFDPSEFSISTYRKGILTLGQAMKERPHYRGYFLYEKVMKDFPFEYSPEALSVPHPTGIDKNTNEYARAKFRNYIDAIRQYSIYFNPTYRSPMPRSRGEAMMCGLVSVSANTHDVDMFIKNGINGFYSNDPGELREYLLFLSKNLNKAIRIGCESRKTAEKVFNIHRYLQDWEKVIKDLMK